jgi:anti-sigma factor RsiW
MKKELALKLQAHLDGELPAGEAEEVLQRLKNDPEAQALQAELKLTKSLIKDNELETKIGESREFYWSKIAREIERERTQRAPGTSHDLFWWLRWLVPLGGVALLALLISTSQKLSVPAAQKLGYLQEIENHLGDMSLISFRSESEGFSVVWVNSQ